MTNVLSIDAAWTPTGKWGHRDGQSPNWTLLPDIANAFRATLGRIKAGDEKYAREYGTWLARKAHQYLRSWRAWSADSRLSSITPPPVALDTSRAISPARAIRALIQQGWTVMKPGDSLSRVSELEARQCGSCLAWRPGVMVYLTRQQRIVLCEDCR